MNKLQSTDTILDMVQGGVNEIINSNIADILLNIKDPNTDTKARELVIKVKLQPADEKRRIVNVIYDTQKKIRPIKPLAASISIGIDDDGQLQAKELIDELDGQIMYSGEEVPQGKVLNFNVKNA